MIEIDCRKCVNADLEADCCKLYGNDPDTAVRECAADEFVNYKEVNKNGLTATKSRLSLPSVRRS